MSPALAGARLPARRVPASAGGSAGVARPAFALALLAGACAALLAGSARAQTLRGDFFITNGQVNAEALRGTTLYVGGSFTAVGPVTGSGVPVDVTTGVPAPGFPRVNGTVMSAIADGSGGWFIGGLFTAVGATPRANLAHVLADQSVAAWNPGTGGAVRALLLQGGVLFVGGDFTTLGGIARNRIGAVNASSGAVTPWDPNANASVRVLATNGSVLWAGGQFTTIGGQARNRIAQLSFATGAADPSWNPNANSTVLALAYDGSASLLYAAGQFTSLGGPVRNRIAAIDVTTGAVTTWNPNSNNQVNAIVTNGADVYVGGTFTNVGGQGRSRIAAVSAATGSVSSWNPNATGQVQALALSGSTIYAGGDFLTIGGQNRSRVAGLDAATGLATAWNPGAFGSVSTFALSGSQIFIGGTFNGMGGTARNNLAAFDVTTGQVSAWDPNANGTVLALASAPDAIYAGGAFTQVGGKIRNFIAALDLTNGQASAWDPNCDGGVSALAVAGNRVYVGGLFAGIGGQARQNLAAVDATTGLALSWSADADDQVFAIDASTPTVYVGGNFLTLGGVSRAFAGAVSAATGAVTPWDPAASGTVRGIAPTCDRAYVAGFFSSIGGQTRNELAAVDLATGAALAWNPNMNGPVLSIIRQAGVVYVGGVFSAVGAVTRNRVAALDPLTGTPTSWDPNSNGTVRALVADASAVYIGGSFSSVSASPSGNLAVVTPDASLSCPAISLTAPPLPAGVVGTGYATTLAASGGTAPYCFGVSAGSLPAGLSLDATSGQITGTPSAAGLSVFSITATDARGCPGTTSYTMSVTSAPAANSVAANGAGLCLNPSQTCVSVPFVLTRGDAVGLRAVSTTFQLESAKLRLCAPGVPASNAHLGSWANGFPNRSLQLTDLGGGRYTVDVALLGSPCGATQGGVLFTLDVAAQGPAGTGAVTVQSVAARDCGNAPVAASPGAAGSVNISSSTIALSPSTLPGGFTGASYSQQLSASGTPGPFTFAITAGSLPNGLSLSGGGLLSGTVLQAGTFSFTITATDAGGCPGSRAYSFTFTCPTIAVSPAFLPDGAVGSAYSASLAAPAGAPPVSFAVTAGALPAGLTLAPAGLLSGTPGAAGPASFTVTATDAAGCTGSRAYSIDIFSSPPVSSVAANTSGLAISTAHPCVSVPIEYTRGEATPARGLTVSFQLDAAKLALCSTPAASIHLGSWFNGFGNTQLLITDDGGGAYTVDASLVGTPCGITTGGVVMTVDLKSVDGDGSGAITVTRVKSHDCAGAAIAVMADPPAALRIQNTNITLAPPVLPNGIVGTPYSQAITAQSGIAPFTFSVSAGALPAGLSLAADGTLSGTPTGVGSFSFTVSVSDRDGVPGSRAYAMSVTCPAITVSPGALPDGQVGAAYEQTLTASGGTGPYSFVLQDGTLPAGLSLSSAGVISGTPSAPSSSVITIAAVDAFDCVGTEVYTLAVFTDPAISHVTPSTAGLCLSATHTCVNVPFTYQRGDATPAGAAHVTFQLDSRLALCTPGTPSASIHPGSWLASFSNKTFQIIDHGGGSYSVDQALLGSPCGPTTGGVLFTVDVAAAGLDGAGNITVTEVRIRDCSNQPLPGQPGPAAQLIVSHAPPPAIADLVSTQVTSGNPPGQRTGIAVTFTPPAAGAVALYRAPFGSYPEYDDDGGTAPDSATAPGAPWTLVSASAPSGLVDTPPTRGFWHYVAFFTDSCGNISAVSNRSQGSLDYHLGDVTNGVTRGTGDNRVSTEDVSLLGAHYGLAGTAIVSAGVGYLDVGPTVNGLNTGRPATDDTLNFNDLIVFATNFQSVSAPQSVVSPAPSRAHGAAGESFELSAPAIVQAGDEIEAVLHVTAGGGMQGFSVQLGWDGGVVAPLAVSGAGFIESQGGVVLSPGPGGADAALLGVRGTGISGSGDVARFRFRVLRDGDPGLRVARLIARDAANRQLSAGSVSSAAVIALPAHTLMLAPSPNPAPGATTLAFALAERGEAELAIFAVDGSRVRTLAHGPRDAGAYRLPWRGEDDAGHAQSAGVYWARLTAAGRTFTRRIVLLR